LTGFDHPILQIKTKIVSSHTAYSKPVKQVNVKVILPLLVFSGLSLASFLGKANVCAHRVTWVPLG
jgi:hypothetical protein